MEFNSEFDRDSIYLPHPKHLAFAKKYWRDNVDQYVDSSTGWKVWRRVKWASHNWTPETTFDYMLKHTRVIKPGMDQDVNHFLGRLQRVYERE